MSVFKWILRQIDDLLIAVGFLLIVGFLAEPRILGGKVWVLLLVGCGLTLVVVVLKCLKGRRKARSGNGDENSEG